MIFNKAQNEMIKKIGINPESISTDDDIVNLEERVADWLAVNGFDGNYEPTEDGKICESILDVIGNE